MLKAVHRVNKIFILPSESETDGFTLLASGNTFTSGWTNVHLVPCKSKFNAEEGEYEFNMVATAPDCDSLPITAAISAEYVFSSGAKNLKSIKVYAESNSITSVVFQASGSLKESNLERHQFVKAMKSLAYSLSTGILPRSADKKTVENIRAV